MILAGTKQRKEEKESEIDKWVTKQLGLKCITLIAFHEMTKVKLICRLPRSNFASRFDLGENIEPQVVI